MANSGTTSVWQATEAGGELVRGKLERDTGTDVCIIGAGIAGMTTAYLLAREGKKVIVIDDGPIGGGETGHTTAHLTAALDDRYFEIEKLHGEKGARYAAESHMASINRIEMIVREEKIDCEFERVDGYLFLKKDDSHETLERELEACHRAGISDVQLLTHAPLDAFDTGPCLIFPRQAQFHPLKYLAALAKAIERNGGRIFTGTHVTSVTGKLVITIETDAKKTVKADACVAATNSPITDMFVTSVKQAPYRTFVIGVRVPASAVPHMLLWDTGSPYHYIRVERTDTKSEEILIVGGEDHKTGQADDGDARFGALEEWTRAHFPMAGEVAYRWSGQVLEPYDYMAMIGHNPGDNPNVYIATGDSGNGMTHGTIAGMLLTDMIVGRDNPWAPLYAPDRVSISASSVVDLARENLNVAVQYAKDYVHPSEVHSADDIPLGSGAILRDGTHILAIYRDTAGGLHKRNAKCTHLKCIVHWNSLEDSWDCPCHGSRFTAYGDVLNGPALTGLEEG
ncbi:MAG: FAD-dependent oxidoreductase [Gemmatimonadota bacterium]|nr:FAD-dependent oxidoreductase [Gemmatimonadota bacterium]